MVSKYNVYADTPEGYTLIASGNTVGYVKRQVATWIECGLYRWTIYIFSGNKVYCKWDDRKGCWTRNCMIFTKKDLRIE